MEIEHLIPTIVRELQSLEADWHPLSYSGDLCSSFHDNKNIYNNNSWSSDIQSVW